VGNGFEKRTSCLTTLPLAEQGFYLPKQELWDAIHMRYDQKLENIPVCGAAFSSNHAKICNLFLFTTMIFETSLLSGVLQCGH